MLRKNIEIIFFKTGSKEGKKVLVDREKFIYQMEGLKRGFINDNEVATKFLDKVEDIESIEIDEQTYRTQDIPFVVVKNKENKREVLRIRRANQIIWSILLGYCTL